MRKIHSIVCVICLALLVPLILRAKGALPFDTRPLIGEKYGEWAGVLRLWVYEGWPAGVGSAAGWLNRCIDSFEKRHPGVYVQPEYVDADAMAALGTDNLLPDLALFPPGAVATPSVFAELTIDTTVRAALSGCGLAEGHRRAVPVAAGGYAWALNTSQAATLPGSWRESGLAIACPADEPCRMWTGALLGLCSARCLPETSESAPPSADLDLGLPMTGASPTPAPTAVPETAGRDCLLPEGFTPGPGVWEAFINGEAAAMPVTQREVARLSALSEQGRGPEWRLAVAGNPLLDQLLLLGAVDREGLEARRALCVDFAEHLLSDECQGQLNRAGMFSVTDAPSGYGAGDPLAIMEAFTRSGTPVVPPAFGDSWRAQAEAIVREYLKNKGSPAALWRTLSGAN